MGALQPIIVLTIYRRYHELRRCILRIRELEREFSVKPKIVVVWAQPEQGMEWLFNGLGIDLIIKRPKLLLEGVCGGTTYPESNNIRIGFEESLRNWGENIYFILQTVDIYVEEGIYGEFDTYMQKGGNLGVFHWQNSCVSAGAYHTNFFCVSTNRDYWPPLSDPNDHDCLEWQWGKILGNYTRPPGTPPKDYQFRVFNLSYFKHKHIDNLTHLPVRYSVDCNTMGKDRLGEICFAYMKGYKDGWFKKFIRNENSALVSEVYHAWLSVCYSGFFG